VIYAYAREDQDWWEERLGRPIEPGGFGENLTLMGVDVTNASVGERWRVGTAVLEVSSPRVPCWKLGARMEDPAFPRAFAAAGRSGAYLRVIEEGDIGMTDSISVVARPQHRVSVGTVSHIYHRDHARAHLLVNLPALAGYWHTWVARQLRSQTHGKGIASAAGAVHEARKEDFLPEAL
jgi:MOSC domain-containing protein YiiM